MSLLMFFSSVCRFHGVEQPQYASLQELLLDEARSSNTYSQWSGLRHVGDKAAENGSKSRTNSVIQKIKCCFFSPFTLRYGRFSTGQDKHQVVSESGNGPPLSISWMSLQNPPPLPSESTTWKTCLLCKCRLVVVRISFLRDPHPSHICNQEFRFHHNYSISLLVSLVCNQGKCSAESSELANSWTGGT